MSKFLQMLYALVAYVFFFGTFLYLVGFLGGLVVPKTIDSGPEGPWLSALIINLVLIGIFAIQHTVMARPAFKSWWTKIVPNSIERSTYVVATNLTLVLLFWQWRPLTSVIWDLDGVAGQIMFGVFGFGWLVVLISTFMLSHFELFGLTQAYAGFRGRVSHDIPFHTPMLYGLVRHPIMLGFIIAIWAAPTMSLGHLVFAFATTLYILIALHFFEERDLLKVIGTEYADYRRRVPMLIPFSSPRAGRE
tara:strand:+ start:1661 stop:2404 length:744 start_codon:yes stop_codon:yes gene_type:complete